MSRVTGISIAKLNQHHLNLYTTTLQAPSVRRIKCPSIKPSTLLVRGESRRALSFLVGDHSVHLVNGGGEGSQTDLLRVGHKLGTGLAPGFRHLKVLVCVHQQIKTACKQQHRQLYILQSKESNP